MNDTCAEVSEANEARLQASGQLKATPRPKGAPLEVIIVDDSLPMRERLAASLVTLEGVDIIGQADDVPAGLSLLEQRRPDVLILDIELPGQSGMDLLKIAHRRNFAPVIIMFSIYDHPKLRQMCLGQGAAYYFHKLTQFDRVAEVCRELTEQRRAQAG
jgi:DNA-binding NarL/FixJ family response regulator